MRSILIRILLILLPWVYMAWVWYQSSNFNPSELEHYYVKIPQIVLLAVGVALELAHLFEFGLLYLFIIMAFLSFGKLNSKKEIAALLVTLAYSCMDEIHQYFVPFRSFSIVDMVKNIIGIWFAWYFVRKSYYSNKETRLGIIMRGFKNISK